MADATDELKRMWDEAVCKAPHTLQELILDQSLSPIKTYKLKNKGKYLIAGLYTPEDKDNPEDVPGIYLISKKGYEMSFPMQGYLQFVPVLDLYGLIDYVLEEDVFAPIYPFQHFYEALKED